MKKYLATIIILLCSCQIRHEIPSTAYTYTIELHYLDGGAETINVSAYGDLDFNIGSKFGSYWIIMTNQGNVNHPDYTYFKCIKAVTRYKLVSKELIK